MKTKPTVSLKKTTAADATKLAGLAEQLSSPAGRENTHQQFQNAAQNWVLRRGTLSAALCRSTSGSLPPMCNKPTSWRTRKASNIRIIALVVLAGALPCFGNDVTLRVGCGLKLSLRHNEVKHLGSG